MLSYIKAIFIGIGYRKQAEFEEGACFKGKACKILSVVFLRIRERGKAACMTSIVYTLYSKYLFERLLNATKTLELIHLDERSIRQQNLPMGYISHIVG